MNHSFKSRPITVFFSVAVAVLAWISVTSYWSAYRLVGAFDAVAQGSQILDTLQYVETLMESAESSARGYVITGDGATLSGYDYARLLVPYKMKQLTVLVAMRPAQKKRIRSLTELLDSQLHYLARIVEERRSGGYATAAQAITQEDSASRRNALAHLLSETQQEERMELDQRRSHATEHSWENKFILGGASAVILMVLGWAFGLLRREHTERRQAENAVTRTETFIHSIVEHIPYMILVKEAKNLRLTLANKAAEEWLGRTREDLLGSNELDRGPRDEAHEAIQKDREILRAGKNADIPEESITAADGTKRLLHTQKISVPDENGEPAYLLSISEDITQRRQAEKILELSRDSAVESARMKSEFIANMTHEIRTPLAIIIGMNDLLLDTELTADQKKFSSTVKKAAAGLLTISKTILDFSKIEAGAFALETQDVDMHQVVEGVVAMLQEQSKAKGVGLASLIYNEIPPVVLGDGVRVRQVLTHLIANAVKFTARGEIVVRVTKARETDSQIWLQCRVTDTGIGIAEEAQKHLFEPFRQADGSQTRRYGGTGLGLALSKRMVELMGGEIGFESVVGEGSTFWFVLPFNKRHVRGPVVQMPSLSRTRVLIVDDNETYRQLLQQHMRGWSITSETVSQGQAAFDLLRREEKAGRAFPIVLTSMHLADMDAVSLARMIRADPALAETHLLVMTREDAPLDPETCANLGFSGWVTRSTQPDELYERFASLIEPAKKHPKPHAA